MTKHTFTDPEPWLDPTEDDRYPEPVIDGVPMQGMLYDPRTREQYDTDQKKFDGGVDTDSIRA